MEPEASSTNIETPAPAGAGAAGAGCAKTGRAQVTAMAKADKVRTMVFMVTFKQEEGEGQLRPLGVGR